MDTIKLRSKGTSQIHECGIHLGNLPQTVEVLTKDGEGYGYFSFDDLAKEWEIVPNEELMEDK